MARTFLFIVPTPGPGLAVAIKWGASLIAREGKALSGWLIDFLTPEVDPKILAYCDALHPVVLVVNFLTKTEEGTMQWSTWSAP